MGINLGTYNFWDGCGFILPLDIRSVEKWNYDLMLLMETKIAEAIYCCNRRGYEVLCSKATFTMARGSRGGWGRQIRIARTAGAVDCRVNTLPQDDHGEL